MGVQFVLKICDKHPHLGNLLHLSNMKALAAMVMKILPGFGQVENIILMLQ